MSMKVIEHIELASAASTIVLDEIPDTYTDLYIVVSARNTATADDYYRINLNGSSANFSGKYLGNNGSTTVISGTSAPAFGRITQSDYTANTFSSSAWYLPNYAGDQNKNISVDNVSENNGGEYYLDIVTGLWSQTAAIHTVSFVLGAGNFAIGSSATLYGITAGSDETTTVS